VCTRGQWQPPNLTGCSGSLFGVTPSIISGFGTQAAGQCLLGLVALGGIFSRFFMMLKCQNVKSHFSNVKVSKCQSHLSDVKVIFECQSHFS